MQELCERLPQRDELSEPLPVELGAARRRITEPAAQPGQVSKTFSTVPSCEELAKPSLDVGREHRQVFDILPIRWTHSAPTSKPSLIFVHNRRDTKGMNAGYCPNSPGTPCTTRGRAMTPANHSSGETGE